LILASASPQRRAILEQIGIPFRVRVPAVPELQEGPPAEVVLENAFRKAAVVAAGLEAGAEGGISGLPVLGVDTVVSLGARIFGKPRDAAHAAEMLAALAGRRHVVFSGLCLIEPGPGDGRTRTAAAETVVEFRALDRSALDAYVATGEWQGRAGAYAIQGVGATLVNRIEGDYLSVVGLPVSTLLDLAPWLLLG
jgi:septum formation protein